MPNEFLNIIDTPQWKPATVSPAVHVAGASICSDLRNGRVRNPFIYQVASATSLLRYNAITKSWSSLGSPALTGTFGTGAGSVFAPSRGLFGTISTGSSTTMVTTSTTITAVAPNMLANRGGSGDYGFKVRIISVSSGKTEERWIVGNTGGTTPTLYLDSALTFTPASGDTYEILGGRVMMLSAGTTATGCWRSFETVANSLASLSVTNLPTTIGTDCALTALDEQYVPYDCKSGEGFILGSGTYDGGSLKCLVATASASGTITGQATGGDASVLANEYRNFQIRIVEDTVNVTAVGQRRIIASHTAGASPVYTLGSAWSVTPSANAKFVIEYPNLILLRSSATAVTYTYNYSGASITNGTNTIASDAWHVTYFGNAPAVMGAGSIWMPSFGIRPDTAKNARHSYIYNFRSTTVLDVLDIAGSITGTWTGALVYDGSGSISVNVGTSATASPYDNEGRFFYINNYIASAVNQLQRFDVKNRVLSPFTPTDWIQAGTASAGNRLASVCAFKSDTEKYSCIFLLAHLATNTFEHIVQI